MIISILDYPVNDQAGVYFVDIDKLKTVSTPDSDALLEAINEALSAEDKAVEVPEEILISGSVLDDFDCIIKPPCLIEDHITMYGGGYSLV